MPPLPSSPPMRILSGHSCPSNVQYSLTVIFAIWISVTIPMGLLAWVVAPLLIPHTSIHPGIVYWLLMIVGMIWQFVVAAFVLYRENNNWTWLTLKERLWLNTPVNPVTGQKSRLLWLVIIPALLFSGLISGLLGDVIDAPVKSIFPSWTMPLYTDIRTLISPDFAGCWWLLPVALISCLFNYFLGEALLFHGVLLPKMMGAFGKHAWLANGVLFGLYHVHLLGSISSIIVSNFAYSFPAQRYRSNWLAVVVHGFEGLILLGVVTWVMLGLTGKASS